MLIPKQFHHRKSIQNGYFAWMLIGTIVLLLSGCSTHQGYLDGQFVNSPENAGYGTGNSQNLYSQNQTEQWQNPNTGLNPQNDLNVPGMYPQNAQGSFPQGYPNNGAVGYQGNPPLNTGQQTGGFSSSGNRGYWDDNVSRVINNMQIAQKQTLENPQSQNQLASPSETNLNVQGSIAGYPPTSANPMVTNVAITENGFPTSAANPSPDFEQISNPNIAQLSISRLPTIQVPVPQGINPATLTQPAIGMTSSFNGSYDTIIQQKERWFADHPGDINTAMFLYYYYLAENNQQKAQSFLPKDFNQADLTQNALRDLEKQISVLSLLKVTNLKICDKVDGFGRYLELPAQDLQSGKGRWVEVYFELENYANRLNADGMYRSEIYAEITLYDSSYRSIIPPLAEDVPPKPTYSPRDDFYLRGTIQLPALNPGTYIIAVTVQDKIANKRSKTEEFVFHVGSNLASNNYAQPAIR